MSHPIDRLSQRELDVALRLTRGNTDKHIARELGLSHHTVKGYVRDILLKCGVHDRDLVHAVLVGQRPPAHARLGDGA